MKRVRVAVQPPYDVVIGDGALDAMPPMPGRLAVVVDETVWSLHRARLESWLAPRPHVVLPIPSGESHKTLATVSALYDRLAAERFERGEALVAIGGGVTGDLAGFVAATWRRGLSFVQVPTTLLAQVDASVGGKVAIDHPAGKNLIGAFHQPCLVLADPVFLTTLPERQLHSGLAEVVKAALLDGGELLSLVDSSLERIAADGELLEQVVSLAVAFKAGVVQRDPDERGERAVLNLGHTVGHALEQASGYSLLHGEAVAYGLRAALSLSGHAADSAAMRLVRRLPVPPLPALDRARVLQAMRSDKKVRAGQLRFVLLPRVGAPEWGVVVDEARVAGVVDALLTGRS